MSFFLISEDKKEKVIMNFFLFCIEITVSPKRDIRCKKSNQTED